MLIPGENDSDEEIEALTQWVAKELKPDIPLHFTAFHPDYRMLDTAPTPLATVQRARAIALKNGLEHVYVGNVHDPAREATICPTCGTRCIGRDGYRITEYNLDATGACRSCGTTMAGVFADKAGRHGARAGCRSRSSATRRDRARAASSSGRLRCGVVVALVGSMKSPGVAPRGPARRWSSVLVSI